MTPTQRVALWERVNAYAEVCGADTSDGAVGADRQRAVVALESEIEAFERKASASAGRETLSRRYRVGSDAHNRSAQVSTAPRRCPCARRGGVSGLDRQVVPR
jgi:hypothetical protein